MYFLDVFWVLGAVLFPVLTVPLLALIYAYITYFTPFFDRNCAPLYLENTEPAPAHNVNNNKKKRIDKVFQVLQPSTF